MVKVGRIFIGEMQV